MFGSLQLAPTNYYNVSTSVGNVETRLLLGDIGGHFQHPYRLNRLKLKGDIVKGSKYSIISK